MAAEGSADGLVLLDSTGRVLSCNPFAEHLLGVPAGTLTGQLLTEVPAEFTRADGSALPMIASNDPTDGAVTGIRTEDGGVCWVALSSCPVSTPSGGDGYLLTLRDLTDGLAAEQTLRILKAFVEATDDAVLTLSLDGVVLSWNRGAERMTGWRADDVIGQHLTYFGSDGRETLDLLARAARGQTVRAVEARRRRSDGTEFEVSLIFSPIYDAQGVVVAVSLIARDIGDRRELELQLASQALHDSLTGLPNRALLRDRLEQALAGSERREVPVAVLFLDLDGFRAVNDAHGEPASDRLLVNVAKRLQTEVRPGDTVARYGGDEFLIVCDAADVAEAEQVAHRMTAAFKHPFVADGRTIAVSASIGIAVTPPLRADVDVLLRSAYAAMSDAKAHGGAGSRIFDASLAKQLADRAKLSEALREALAGDRLAVHYQPVVQIATGRLVGVEALTRWEHPILGEISPDVFVPLAEEEGFVSALDRWVLARVCRDAAVLRTSGALPADGKVALNLSACNLGDPSMLEAVRRAALGAGLPLDALEIEVTETAVMNDPVGAAKTLADLRTLGVGIALDDFGTGYSSLTYLRQLPVSTIKIDRSFIHDIIGSADGRAIVAAVVDLARAVGARTIAEGVEDRTQLELLHKLGCTTGQGYLWSMALPRDELIILLRQQADGFQAATGMAADGRADDGRANQVRRPRADEPWLSRMRHLHAEGASAATIAAALNTEGHRTPAGVRWQANTVKRAMADVEQRRRTRLSI